MDLGLKNKVALVAASSRGLGKSIAWGLAKEGTKLVICARNKEVLEHTADEILLQTGVTVFPLAMDLSNREEIDWLVQETMDLFGRIDILVTNNGGPPVGTVDSVSEDDWQIAVQNTLMSASRLSQAVLPSMVKNKWGRIIHLTSVTAKQPMERLYLSNVLRPAVVGMSKSQSNLYSKHGIMINAVCPGYFLTDRVENLIQDQMKTSGQSKEQILSDMAADIPISRIGNPDELANFVVFLASEKASYMTGGLYQVDGGLIRSIF